MRRRGKPSCCDRRARLEGVRANGLKHGRVRGIVIIAALIGVASAAAAQVNAPPPERRSKAEQRAPARPLPVVIPQQFAPPQEAYASLPDAAAAAAPAAPSACQLRLAKIAGFQPLPTLVGAGECGAADAVQMDTVILADQSKVAVTPPAMMRCPMAEAIAQWLRDDVAPSLKDLPPLRVLDNFASYDCRGRNNVRAAQMSEHGKADALDVRAFRLADGREMGLTDINMPQDWRNVIRASACARFSTVLGPGSDGYHEEHIHLDLEPRRNNYKVCQWDVRVPPPPPPPVEAKNETPAAGSAAAPADAAGVEQDAAEDNATPIPPGEVPLPRPRPLAANAARNRSVK